LSGNSGIFGEGKSFSNVCSIQLLSELMLHLEARACGTEVPVSLRHDEARRERSNIGANCISDSEGKGHLKEFKELQDPWSTLHPRRKVSDICEGGPRSKSKATFDKWQAQLNVMDAVEVHPFRRKSWEGMSWQCKM